ncbi:MAG: hypothetical protein HY975_03180 [Candidatus Kerfeldbacteria bacterium]|nr:hypothetical protein [Candidatus Kerfeldbacteria bacterium]
MKRFSPLTIGLAALVLGGLIWWVIPPKRSVAPTTNQLTTNSATGTSNANRAGAAPTVVFSTVDLLDRDPNFSFSVAIPEHWLVEYRPAVKAINMYEAVTGQASLSLSQVFVQYYTGSSFATPTDVTGTIASSQTTAGQPMRTYRLTGNKRRASAGVPSWWSNEHTVVEVQSGEAAPYVYYQFHLQPALTPSISETLWTTLQAGDIPATATTSSNQPV